MKKLSIILTTICSILLTAGIVLAANTFPTTLNNWSAGDIIEEDWGNALEDKIGVNNSSVTSSIDYLIKHASSSLGSIANITHADGVFMVSNGSFFVGESTSTARTSLGLGSVENTALSTWVGSTNITTLGTIATGTWSGTSILNAKIASSTEYLADIYWTGTSTNLVAATGRTSLGLGAMALNPATGSTTITTLGTIATGVWNGTPILNAYIASSTEYLAGGNDVYWTGTSTNLVAATGRTSLGLGAMALNPATGSTTITTLGTIATGVWQGTAILNAYIASSTEYLAGGNDVYWTGTSTNLVAATGRTSLGLGAMALNPATGSTTITTLGTITTGTWSGDAILNAKIASSTEYLSDIYWTGTSDNLVAATGRTSLGLGDMALNPATGSTTITTLGTITTGVWSGTSILNAKIASSTEYLADIYWTGTSVNLVAATGRTSLELGAMALNPATGSTTITTLGTIASGTWAATDVGTAYGGTGKSWNAIATGSIVYFDDTGSMSTLAAATDTWILTTKGVGVAPEWAANAGASLWTDDGTFTYLTSPTNGFVVGGTTTANASFYVYPATGQATIRLEPTFSGGGLIIKSTIAAAANKYAHIQFTGDTGGALTMAFVRADWMDTATATAALRFGTRKDGDDNTRMIISTDGYVGIGDESPASMFTVGASDAFQVNATGTITAGIWNGTAILNAYIASSTEYLAGGNDVYWTGTSTNLVAATGRTSLGLGDMALNPATGSTTITTVGTISTGTWEGTAIDNVRGGTGADTSGWTGFAYVTAGTWATSTIDIGDDTNLAGGRSITLTGDSVAADVETYIGGFTALVPDASTTYSADVQWLAYKAFTVENVTGSCATGTMTIQFDERASSTPNTGGTDILNAAMVVDGLEATTTFANAGITAMNIINMDIDAETNDNQQCRIHLRGTYDD